MEKEFIPYEQALSLKELGFDEPCLAHLIGFVDGTKENGKYVINYQQVFYPNNYISSDDKAKELGLYPFGICGVPLFQQAFRWFREKYNLSGVIIPTITMYWTFKTMTVVESIIEVPPYKHVDANDYMTYEEAELACLRKLIEIVKNGK